MIEQSHQISVFFKEFCALIFLEEIGDYFPQNGAEFESMARTGGNNENILVFIGPVDKEVIGFGGGVVAFLHFLYFYELLFKILVDQRVELFHFSVDEILLVG